MTTDPNSQPSQDDVLAASPPFASAGDGFTGQNYVAVDAFNPAGPQVVSSPLGGAPAQRSCMDVMSSLGMYLDGELDAMQSAAMQNHLGTCPACQTAQAFQMQFRSTLAAKALDPMPEDVRARITQALGF